MRLLIAVISFLFLIAFPTAGFPNTYLVTNTSDAGAGSLRQALQNVNIYPGSHTINFNIPTSDPGYNPAQGVWSISLSSTLPMITHSGVLIDGTSQTVFAGNLNPDGPEIMLDGNNQSWADFAFHIYNVSNVTIQGFIIGRFVVGIQVSGTNAQNDTIAGNYIGCNYNATDTLGNTHGIYLLSGPHNNMIGGSTGELRNVVSGNNHVGIRVVHSNNNIIQGNFVGLNRTGNAALRNYDGISIEGTSKYNLIGGNTSAQRNYVAGNVAYGIPVFGAGCDYNVVAGNYVGTDTTGTLSIPNTYGILFDDGASYNTLGGRTGGAGNLLSGNSGYGVFIYNFSTTADTVIGNLIGTDYTGTNVLPNANGIVIDGTAYGHIIESNIISGNLQMGVDIHIAGSDSNVVITNKIGTDITGNLPLSNQLDGVRISEGPKYNCIGLPGKGNIIACNGGNGVTVMTPAEIDNTILSNSIFANQEMGIDLFPQGPTANDPGDTDTGPNELMNTPVVTSITNISTTTNWIVTGYLDHNSPQGCRIELFQAAINGTGNAQGKVFLGFCTVDGSGNFTDTVSGLTIADNIVGTATDLNGNTSEFSNSNPLSINTIVNSFNYKFSVNPNPVANTTTIGFEIPVVGNVIINMIDIPGKSSNQILNESMNEGDHSVLFSKKNLSSGTYLLTLTLNKVVAATQKITIE